MFNSPTLNIQPLIIVNYFNKGSTFWFSNYFMNFSKQLLFSIIKKIHQHIAINYITHIIFIIFKSKAFHFISKISLSIFNNNFYLFILKNNDLLYLSFSHLVEQASKAQLDIDRIWNMYQFQLISYASIPTRSSQLSKII
jgi:hypothetical protein